MTMSKKQRAGRLRMCVILLQMCKILRIIWFIDTVSGFFGLWIHVATFNRSWSLRRRLKRSWVFLTIVFKSE